MRFTIDSSGNLAEASGCIYGTPIQQLVEREGYILIEQRMDKCILWLNCAHISPVAEAALYYFMADSGCVRFAISFLPARHAAMICRSRDAAIRAIADSIGQHRRNHANRFAFRPVDLASVSSCAPLKVLLDNFAGIIATRGMDGVRHLAHDVLKDRYLVVEHRPRIDCFVLRDVGMGYSGFQPEWAKSAAGRALEEQADIHYARWLTRTYRDALAAGRPVAQEVDAAVFRVDHGRRRFAYRRVLLPFVGAGGLRCLLSSSVADPSIDLGVN